MSFFLKNRYAITRLKAVILLKSKKHPDQDGLKNSCPDHFYILDLPLGGKWQAKT